MSRDGYQIAFPQPILPTDIAPGVVPQPMVPAIEGSGGALRPDYGDRFRCIASACEDTCCSGWSVPVDRATYERYRSIDELKPHLGTLIVLNSSSSTTTDFARITLGADASCPFLAADHLCGIQTRFGEEALSNTCATYPRAVASVGGEREVALNLSCPEAARLALLHPDLLGIRSSPASAALLGSQRSEAPQLALREFVLYVIADRSYELWQRMYLLGVLARRLETLSGARIAAEWVESYPTTLKYLLADSGRMITLGRLRPAMQEIVAQPGRQLQVVMQLLRARLSEPPVPRRFMDCVAEFEAGLGCNTATSERQILDAYGEAYQLYYEPLMRRNPHMLENYLSNAVFKGHYPFAHPRDRYPELFEEMPDAELEHQILSLHLSVIQTVLIGIAGHYRSEFQLSHVVKLIQSFARTFEHSRRSQTQMKELIREQALNRLGGVALLTQPPRP